jgi:hypothetical protein
MNNGKNKNNLPQIFPNEATNSTSSTPLDSPKNHPLQKPHNSPFIYLKQPPNSTLFETQKTLQTP